MSRTSRARRDISKILSAAKSEEKDKLIEELKKLPNNLKPRKIKTTDKELRTKNLPRVRGV